MNRGLTTDPTSQPGRQPETVADELAREIKRLRIDAGLSQRALAARVGYSRQYVSMTEWEDATLPSQELVAVLDAALSANGALIALRAQGKNDQQTRRRGRTNAPGTAVETGASLTANVFSPFNFDNSSSDPHDGSIFHLRRVLMGCIPDTSPGTQSELAAEVVRTWDLFFSARFSEMERTLPTVLASAYNAAEATTGEPRRRINISLAQLLHASSNLLGYVDQKDLAALALLRADVLAAESGDELTWAAIKGSQSWLLAKNGMYDDATAYAEHAATEIEPRLSTATPRHISIWGELLCYAAFAASRTGDYRQARRYLRLCESAETQLEDDYISRPEASNMFDRTSAASFGVVNEMAADQPREALKLAAASGATSGIPPVLRSRRLINVAHAQVHNRDNAEAVITLRRACSMAPEFVGCIPLAHTLTNELLTRRGAQRLDGIVGVAEQLGISV
ncbi:helix-turn-helix domain-containing protein [Nocardia sp. NEAU-G5]|uniref:Helix-turn-helix domain-containing protein n=1 Tax=Nocardia albiluteola TaxID=2842303 RepID=A0ABS6BCB6_9NOCA|nr:helix-turn-helix transcriptional regulator [Nocardia albiluteola]MBU3066853.1 helix-turn-helix domain-containing protein [Nocardia albiluteola]